MSAALVVPLLLCAVVLVVSGIAKLADREATVDMFTSLRIPVVPAGPGAAVLPWAEVALAAGLVLARGPLLVVVTVLTLAVFAAYWVVIARALTFDPPVSCACFGRLGGHHVDRSTLLRNTLLVGLAGAGVAAAVRDVNVLSGLAGYDAADWLWLGLVLVTGLLGWLVSGGARPGARAVPVTGGDEYFRVPVPYAVVETVDGQRQTLRELATSQARLLVFLSQRCGACVRVADRLLTWQEQLGGAVGVHAVYYDELDQLGPEAPPAGLLLRQPDRGVSLVLDMPYTPSAVLLGTDGLLAGGPVIGEKEIAAMVDDIVAELAR